MAIQTHKKADTVKLSANFKASEFACKGDRCCSTVLIDKQLVDYLQQIRDHFGKAVIITSGYRCEKHNKAVGGAAGSRHTKGQAADFYINGVAPAEIARYAEGIGVKGIGLYEEQDGNFVHIDTRETKSFWYGHAQKYRDTFGESTWALQLRNLRQGCTGDDVRALQYLLQANGCACGEADGIFGPATHKAVAYYQKNKKLAVDGIVGPDTMTCLLGREKA